MNNEYIDKIFEKGINFYAHTKIGGSNEPLVAHLNLTFKYYEKMEKYKELDIIIKDIIKSIYPKIEKNALDYSYELFKAAIYYHDIGKINPVFQEKIMNNKIIDVVKNTNSEHAIYSSRIYVDAFLKKIVDNATEYSKEDMTFLVYLIYCFGYIISKHHTELKNMDKYLSYLFSIELYDLYIPFFSENYFENLFNDDRLENIVNKLDLNREEIYILNKLLYSVLVTADYYATYEFSSGCIVNFDNNKNDKLFNKYESSKLFNLIKDYNDKNVQLDNINKLRCDMYLEVEENLKNNLDKNIFYLEAPTGAGKTNMAINISRIIYKSIRNVNSINYIFPFNTLIEQTSNTFNEYFEIYKDFVVINSINSMVDENKEILDYDIAYIENVFCHYPIKITSHVNLFDTLFGIHKSSNYTLYNFINSVVIIDEIQAYSNKIWRHIINMLDKYAKTFNIKFVIMSATLPKLDYLTQESSSKYCSLIKNKEIYYSNTLFRDRVKIDFSLLKEELTLELLKEKILKYKGKKLLIEFIKKQTARDFYNLIKDDFELVYEITGDDNNYIRKKIIRDINSTNNVVVVSTQTIEAGVDIDMDVGFKDISFLDSEEQFLGRINRSSKKKDSIAFFFNFDNAALIYKGDYRLEFDIKNDDIKNNLITKEFDEYYIKVMDKIYKSTENFNKDNFINLPIQCSKLNYKKISDDLKLIDNNMCQIFLNYKISTDDGNIIGKNIWEKYKEICMNNDLSFSKKQIELSKIKEKFNLFIYNIYDNSNKECKYYTEEFGRIFYIEDGDRFSENGKFDRKKYQNYTGGIFL